MISIKLYCILYYQFFRHLAALTWFWESQFWRVSTLQKSPIIAYSIIIGDSYTHLFSVKYICSKGSCVCWLVPSLHFLWPFVDFSSDKSSTNCKAQTLQSAVLTNSVYTVCNQDWCALLLYASNRINVLAYTMVTGQTSTWVCVLHHFLCLTDEFKWKRNCA